MNCVEDLQSHLISVQLLHNESHYQTPVLKSQQMFRRNEITNALWTSSYIRCAEFVSLQQPVTIFSRRMWKMITYFHSLLPFRHQTHDANLCSLANGILQAFLITCKLRNKSDCKLPFIIVCTYSIQNCNIQSFIVYLMTLLAAPAMGDNKYFKRFCEETRTKDTEWKT